VTVARQIFAAYRSRTGEGLSFTAYLVFCLAQAVDKDKTVQARLKGRKQMVIFDDVNVVMMVEREAEGKRQLMGHVIRAANRAKSARCGLGRCRRAVACPPGSALACSRPGRCPGCSSHCLLWPDAATRRFVQRWPARLPSLR
jgi:hypothetical protein